MFVDSHCHLEGPRFNQDRAETLARARAVGVDAVLAIGNGDGPDDVGCAIKLADEFDRSTGVPPVTQRSPAGNEGVSPATQSRRDDSLVAQDAVLGKGCVDVHQSRRDGPTAQSPKPAARSPRIYATIGIHPHEARLAEERHYQLMESLAHNPRVLAIGEIGLDYHYDHSPRDVQRSVFLRQCELAAASRLPIVIHCRPSDNSTNAWDELLDLLRDAWAGHGLGGVLHCFTGQPEHARAALDLGFMISFAGNVTYPKATNIQQTAREVPIDRMFVETDSPYLGPIPYRGKRNEPAYVVETAKFIAALRGITVEELGSTTTGNFYRFFGVTP